MTVVSGRDHGNLKKMLRKEIQAPERDESLQFFAALGQCIAAWQLVEASLYSVFEQLIGVSDKEAGALSAAFHGVPSFRGRLDMTHAAAQKAMPTDELLTEWNSLYEKAVKKSGRRNAIAHSVVLFDPGRKPKNGRLFLGPSMMDTKRASPKGYSDPKVTIQERQLGDAWETFMDLHAKLLDMRSRIFHAKRAPASS
jgi:hypothetical protein